MLISISQSILAVPDGVFQAKVTKYVANVGLNMLININSGFAITTENALAIVYAFSNFAHRCRSRDRNFRKDQPIIY